MLKSLRSWVRDTVRHRHIRRLSVRRQPVGLHLERFEDRITPTAGVLDTTFNGTGTRTTNFISDFNGSSNQDEAKAVAVQADGKIIVVGDSGGALSFDFALARYNSDGSLDTTFGNNGLVLTDFAGGNDFATGVVVQADGHIIVSGIANVKIDPFGDTADAFALARYDSKGVLDPTFGTGGLSYAVPTGSFGTQANALAVEADGSFIVVGSVNYNAVNDEFAAVHFRADGTFDSSFGDHGVAHAAFIPGTSSDVAWAVNVQSTGKIVLAGGMTAPGPTMFSPRVQDFGVMRFNADGTLDQNFGAGGKVSVGLQSIDVAQAVATQADGSIIVGGYSITSGNTFDFAVTRFTSGGSLDQNFGSGGFATVDFGSSQLMSTDRAFALALQGDGKIVVVGDTRAGDSVGLGNFALARFTSVGALDASFGSGGTTITDISNVSDDHAYALALQGDGKVVVVGSSSASNNNYDFAVARYLGDVVVSTPPHANAGGPYSVAEGSSITLDGTASTAGSSGGSLTYVWDLNGNGIFGEAGETGATPTFSAANLDGPSQVTVQLRVTDASGHSDTASAVVNVTNVKPAVDLGPDLMLKEGDSVTLHATVTDPGVHDTFTYAWTVVDAGGKVVATGNQSSLPFTPADNGTYTATLVVTDHAGLTGTDILQVTVNNVAPTANAGGNVTCDEGSTVTFHGSATDPGVNDTFTYAWVVTDGTGKVVATGNAANLSFTPADNGAYTATLTVTDKDGGSGTSSAGLTVNNVAPTAKITGVAQPTPNFVLPRQKLTFSGLFTDPGILDGHTVTWSFGDGSSTTTSYGSSGSESFSVNHAYTAPGTYTVTLKVTDKDGGVGTAQITLVVKSPGGATDTLLSTVQNLPVAQLAQKLLSIPLDHAADMLARDKTKQAINDLHVFILIASLENRFGILTDDQAASLIAAANAIIASLC